MSYLYSFLLRFCPFTSKASIIVFTAGFTEAFVYEWLYCFHYNCTHHPLYELSQMSALILAHLPRAVRQQSSSSSSPLPPALPHGDCPGVGRSTASPEPLLLNPAPLSKSSKCHRAVICSQVTVPGEWLPLQQTLQTPGLFQEFLYQGLRRDVSRGLVSLRSISTASAVT